MGDVEKLERVLRRIQARHSDTRQRGGGGFNLREVETRRDLYEALDYLERVREEIAKLEERTDIKAWYG